MLGPSRLPTRLPAGTKYVVEARGRFVRRYVELPNGRIIPLARRKALSCACTAQRQTSIVPNELADVSDDPMLLRRIFA